MPVIITTNINGIWEHFTEVTGYESLYFNQYNLNSDRPVIIKDAVDLDKISLLIKADKSVILIYQEAAQYLAELIRTQETLDSAIQKTENYIEYLIDLQIKYAKSINLVKLNAEEINSKLNISLKPQTLFTQELDIYEYLAQTVIAENFVIYQTQKELDIFTGAKATKQPEHNFNEIKTLLKREEEKNNIYANTKEFISILKEDLEKSRSAIIESKIALMEEISSKKKYYKEKIRALEKVNNYNERKSDEKDVKLSKINNKVKILQKKLFFREFELVCKSKENQNKISILEKAKRYFRPKSQYVDKDLYHLLKQSSWFSSDWYLENYTDVAEQNIDPIQHYLLCGYFEGRNPSPDFDAYFYLTYYRDVFESGSNPLIHYIKFGHKEKRLPSKRHKNDI